MQRKLCAGQNPCPSQKRHILASYVCSNQLPHGGKIQQRARIDNGPVRYFGRQSIEVSMNYGS